MLPVSSTLLLAFSLLQLAQVHALQDPNPITFQTERDLHQRWNFLREIEELWITDPQEMSDHALSHFQSVLSPLNYHPPSILSPPVWFADLTGFSFPNHLLQLMLSIPTAEEVKTVFFRLNPNKASGPDGLTSAFFKATWEFIGPELATSVRNFFASNFLPATVNSTILTLVPKFPSKLILRRLLIHCPGSFYSPVSRDYAFLSFADDLLIFIDGSIESVQQVLQVLKEFETRSGLAVSMQKTSFFASGLSTGETDLIQASMGITLGSLPFRYLGVPVNSRNISLTNCEPLIHQIKTKFSSWSVKSLSFSGRLLLIKTVIAGITTFWCSAFILPKACITRINSLCGQFLEQSLYFSTNLDVVFQTWLCMGAVVQ